MHISNTYLIIFTFMILGSHHVIVIFRSNYNAQLFHYFKRISFHFTSGLQSYSYECLGWCMYVFHICQPSGIRLCKLRWSKKTFAQCCVQTRRKSSDTGQFSGLTFNPNFHYKSLFIDTILVNFLFFCFYVFFLLGFKFYTGNTVLTGSRTFQRYSFMYISKFDLK